MPRNTRSGREHSARNLWASMRPRRDAAEYTARNRALARCAERFNEAAA